MTGPRRLQVALTGMDGTGKSTQSALLREYLKAGGRDPVVVHHCSPLLSPVRAAKARLRDTLIPLFKRIGAHERYEGERPPSDGDGAPGGGGSVAGRVLGAAIGWQLVLAGFGKSWYHHLRFGRRGLVYDRCFLDDMVKARWRFGAGWELGRRLLPYVPAPERLFYLDLDPAVAYSRKKSRNCSMQEFAAKAGMVRESLELARASGWQVRELPIEGNDAAAVHGRIAAELAAVVGSVPRSPSSAAAEAR